MLVSDTTIIDFGSTNDIIKFASIYFNTFFAFSVCIIEGEMTKRNIY